MDEEAIEEATNLAFDLDFVPIPLIKGTKRPFRPGWQNETREGAERFFSKPRKGINIGVLTGKASDITVVDVEKKDLEDWHRFVLAHNDGKPINTLTVITGGGGRHYYFVYFPSKNSTRMAMDTGGTFDVRSDAGQVVFVNSIHPNGNVYEFEEYPEDNVFKIKKAPKWLQEYIQRRQK